jgi:hypothetical protein
MINQLFDYIVQQLKQGTPTEVISSNLLSQGWQQKDIDEALFRAQNQNSATEPIVTKGNVKINGKVTTSLKKELIVLLIIIGLVIVGIMGSKWFVTIGTKTIPGTTTSEYQDKIVGYRFVYPNTWTTERATLTPGYIEVIPPDKKTYFLYFWYKDSQAIKSMADLEVFVKDDAAYAESQQDFKTIKIFSQQLGNLNSIVWDYQDKDGTISRVYYVADFTSDTSQNIFILTAGILNKTNSLDAALADQDLQKILASYRFLVPR